MHWRLTWLRYTDQVQCSFWQLFLQCCKPAAYLTIILSHRVSVQQAALCSRHTVVSPLSKTCSCISARSPAMWSMPAMSPQLACLTCTLQHALILDKQRDCSIGTPHSSLGGFGASRPRVGTERRRRSYARMYGLVRSSGTRANCHRRTVHTSLRIAGLLSRGSLRRTQLPLCQGPKWAHLAAVVCRLAD